MRKNETQIIYHTTNHVVTRLHVAVNVSFVNHLIYIS
jgi:hypothetical protein